MNVLVLVFTYNEKDNILPVIEKINAQRVDGLEILVADDNSPDKTWKLVENKMKSCKNLHLLRRFQDKGRGFAGRDAFKQALKMKARYIVEMDADFSHDPSFIPGLIKAAKQSDVVLGSRFVEGGRLERQSRLRNVITACAGKYIRFTLGINVKDPTSGFRCFSRPALEKINPSTLRATDPFIITEVLYRARRRGLRISEVPIVFKDREEGKSKLGSWHLARYLFRVAILRFRKF